MCVLVVEDEPAILALMGELLKEAGHEVALAQHAPAAVALVQANPGRFTALVSDHYMPGKMTGAGLIEHVRGLYPAIPVVLATSDRTAVTPQWRERHRVALLHKPYKPGDLVDTLARLLSHTQASARRAYWSDALIRMEGEIACETQVSRSQNPYLSGTTEHGAWDDGWDKMDGTERA